MDPDKWRIKKKYGKWLLYMPRESRPLTSGSFAYCVSTMKHAFKVYYFGGTTRWRDG
jgi:hypothetical protein